MRASRTWMAAGAVLTAVAAAMLLSSPASAATISYTVNLLWGEATPACADPIVCDGTGTKVFHSGTPADEGEHATSLTLTQLPSVDQPGDDPVPIGSLEYCNGTTLDGTDTENVKLEADFDVTGVGTGHTSDIATLVVTTNIPDDPEASADTLHLASDPANEFKVLENECTKVQLLGRVTLEPDLTVSIGPVIDTGPIDTTTTTTATSTTTTTASTTTTTSTTSTTTPSSTTTTTSSSTTTSPSTTVATTTTSSVPGSTTSSVPTQVLGTSSASGSSTNSGSSGSGVSGSSLAATGSSRTVPLVMLAVGLLMMGAAAVMSEFGRSTLQPQRKRH